MLALIYTHKRRLKKILEKNARPVCMVCEGLYVGASKAVNNVALVAGLLCTTHIAMLAGMLVPVGLAYT